MKKILLLTDFSKNSANAISYAMHFFESKECTFYVMHVHKARGYITDDLLTPPTNSIHDSLIKKPKAKLNTLVAKLQKKYTSQNYHFETIIDYDVFTDAINQAIDKLAIDYLVMGSNGESNVKEVIFGSNTINVIEKVNCKTLVIPNDYDFLPVTEFLLPLDSEDTFNDDIFQDVLDFLATFNVHMHVLRISSEKGASKIALSDKERLSLINCKYHIIEDVPIDYAVSSYLQTNPIQMTVFIAEDKTLLERFFSAAPGKELKSRMKLPLLVLHSD